jgi:hypothetical protein
LQQEVRSFLSCDQQDGPCLVSRERVVGCFQVETQKDERSLCLLEQKEPVEENWNLVCLKKTEWFAASIDCFPSCRVSGDLSRLLKRTSARAAGN